MSDDDPLQQLQDEIKGEKEKVFQRDRSLRMLEMKHKKQLQEVSLELETRKVELEQCIAEITQLRQQLLEAKHNQNEQTTQLEQYKEMLHKNTIALLQEKENMIAQLETRLQSGALISEEQQIPAMEQEKLQLRIHIDNLVQQIAELEANNVQLKESHDSELTRLAIYHNEQMALVRKDHKEKEDRLLADLSRQEAQLADIEESHRKERQKLYSSISDLKQQLIEYKSVKDVIANQSAITEQLQSKLQEKETIFSLKHTSSLKEIDKSKADYQRLFEKYQKSATTSRDLTVENNNLKKELSELSKKVEIYQQQHREKDMELEQVVPQFQKQIEELQRDNSQYRASILQLTKHRGSSFSTPEKKGIPLEVGDDVFQFHDQNESGSDTSDKGEPNNRQSFDTFLHIVLSQIVYQTEQIKLNCNFTAKRDPQVTIPSDQLNDLQLLQQQFELMLGTIEQVVKQRTQQLEQKNEELMHENKTLLVQQQSQGIQDRQHFQNEIDRLKNENSDIRVQLSQLKENKNVKDESIKRMNLELQSQVSMLERKRVQYENMISELNQQLMNTKNAMTKERGVSMISPNTSQTSLPSSNDLDLPPYERDRYEKQLKVTRQQLQQQESFSKDLNEMFCKVVREKELLEQQLRDGKRAN